MIVKQYLKPFKGRLQNKLKQSRKDEIWTFIVFKHVGILLALHTPKQIAFSFQFICYFSSVAKFL